MKRRILIVFAQFGEAEATIRHLEALPIAGEIAPIWSEGDQPCCYTYAEGHLAISNVGLHAAQMCVAKYSHLCDEVWNIGFAGALSPHLPIGTLVEIEKVGKYTPLFDTLDPSAQECVDATLPPLLLPQEGYRLISSDFPIYQQQLKERLHGEWDVVDMEGYGVSFAAQSLRKACRIWKIVSDFALPGGRDSIRQHRKNLSQQIALHIGDLLENS